MKRNLDRDGDGRLTGNDAVVGGRQAQAAVMGALDRNGDGRLGIEDVRMLFPDQLDKRIKKAGSLWPHLHKSPGVWVSAIAVVISAIVSYMYYSGQWEGLFGQAAGVIAAALCIYAPFAWRTYHKLSWVRNPLEKLGALAVIAAIAISNIIAFAGFQIRSQDIANNSQQITAIDTKTSVGAASGGLARMTEISAIVSGGKARPGELVPPRDPELVRTDIDKVNSDLNVEGQKHFCKGDKRWCQLSVYCPGRPHSRHCKTWSALNDKVAAGSKLQTELSLAIEWVKLQEKQKSLVTKAKAGGLTTETNTQAKVVSQLFGGDEASVSKTLGVRMAIALEAVIQMILSISMASIIRDADENKRAVMALKQAELYEAQEEAVDAASDNAAAQLRGKLEQMQAAAPGNPVAVELVSAAAPAVADNPPGGVRLEQLFDWREEGLVEAIGGWMSLDDAYGAYKKWAEAKGGHVADAAPVHDAIKRERLLVPVNKPGLGVGYGGMTPVAAVRLSA